MKLLQKRDFFVIYLLKRIEFIYKAKHKYCKMALQITFHVK